MVEPILHVDEQLYLLPPHKSLAKQLFQLIDQQRAYLGIWLPWIDQVKTQQDVDRWLYDAHRYNLGKQHFTTFISWQGEIVGSVKLMRIDRKHQRAELGFWLSKQHQKKGIMTRCCQALIEHSFPLYQLNRIEIRSPEPNARSRAMAQRLGFTREGLLHEHIRIRNQFLDTEIFGLVYRKWEKN